MKKGFGCGPLGAAIAASVFVVVFFGMFLAGFYAIVAMMFDLPGAP